MPTSLREIGNVCHGNTPNRQHLRRFVDEQSYLIPIHTQVKGKYVLGYYVPIWMRDFFLDPNRSQYLYSTSLVVDECRKAIKSLILDPNPDSYKNDGLLYFFTPTPIPSDETPFANIANATRLLESARNGSDKHDSLLLFLSEINWFDIYNRGWRQRHLTNRIVYWVCTTLVG